MSIQRKTETLECFPCKGRGYSFYDSDNFIEYHCGCTSCGGSGRKAIAGIGAKRELNQDTLKKGSGKIVVTYEWDGQTRTSAGEPYWRETGRKPKTGWF